MTKYIIMLVSITVLSVASFFLAKNISDSSYGSPDLANGRELYQVNCMACHGEKGIGDGIASVSMSVKPDSIYEEIKNPFGFKAELIHSVLNGDNGQGGTMPAFKKILSAEDINDIFGYILEVNQAAN
ncbi:MAG: cytochrome c [Symploca sp. SIO2D2]|nr:cytochrome c [Symploca sp. SIO2D2]